VNLAPSRAGSILAITGAMVAFVAGCGDSGGPDSGPVTQIAFQSTRITGYPGIFLMDPDGSNVRPVLADDATTNSNPVLSPDGTRILFSSTRAGKSALYVINVDGTGLARITSDTFAEGNPAWSPDGSKIAFRRSSHTFEGGGLFTANVDGTGLVLVHAYGDQPAWSPDGSRIAFTDIASSGTGNSLYLADPDGSAVTELTSVGSPDDPAWSPDGARIAYGGVGPDNQEIFVVNADGSNPVNITQTPAPLGEIQPAWSPDGAYIVFTGFRNENQEIVRRRADGSGEVVLTSLGAKDMHPTWSAKP
jgi:Tol biopolymer transport system component